MILYTNGCSYTYGAELLKPKEQAWPYVLGNMLGCDVINDASCGISNDCILRRTLEFLSDPKNMRDEDILVVIMWTYLGRFDYYDDLKDEYMTIAPHGVTVQDRRRNRDIQKSNNVNLSEAQGINPYESAFTIEVQDSEEPDTDTDDDEDDDEESPWKNSWMNRWLSFQRKDVDEVYASYMNICSDKWDAWRHFQHALCLQNYLKTNNIYYYFCNVGYNQPEGPLESPREKNMVTDFLEENFVKQIDNKTYPGFTDSDIGISKYTESRGGKNMPRGHPDAYSHLTYSKFISEEIKKLYFDLSELNN